MFHPGKLGLSSCGKTKNPTLIRCQLLVSPLTLIKGWIANNDVRSRFTVGVRAKRVANLDVHVRISQSPSVARLRDKREAYFRQGRHGGFSVDTQKTQRSRRIFAYAISSRGGQQEAPGPAGRVENNATRFVLVAAPDDFCNVDH
jgi:hypothetical protein